MIPSGQHLEADDLLRRNIDYRLIDERKLAAAERVAQIFFQGAPLRSFEMHRFFVKTVGAAPRILGAVKRKIGIAHERCRLHFAAFMHGDADRGANADLRSLDDIRQRQRFDDALGQLFKVGSRNQLGQYDLKFVSTKAPHRATFIYHALKPVRHLNQQGITRGVAQRIVDLLEPVEIEQEQRARLALAHMALERLFEQPVDFQAVGKARQRVVAGELLKRVLRFTHVGEIGAAAAKPLKIAQIVEHRIARYGPPALLIHINLDRKLAEGSTRRKVEA